MDKNTQEFIINNACNYYCKQYTMPVHGLP